MERGIAAKLGLALVCAILLLKCKMSLAVHEGSDSEEERVATEEEIALWDRLNKPGLPLSEFENILTRVENPSDTRIGELTVQQISDYKEMTLDKCQADKWEENDAIRFSEKAKAPIEEHGDRLYITNVGVKTFAEHYRKEMAKWCHEHIREVVTAAIERVGGHETLEFLQAKFKDVTVGPYDLELSARCSAVNKYLRVIDDYFYGVGSQLLYPVLGRDWRQMKDRCAKLIPSIDLWDKLNNLLAPDVDSTLTAVPNKDKTWIGKLTVQQVLDYKEMTLEKCRADMMDVEKLVEDTSRLVWENARVTTRQENAGIRSFAEHHHAQYMKWCSDHSGHVVQAATPFGELNSLRAELISGAMNPRDAELCRKCKSILNSTDEGIFPSNGMSISGDWYRVLRDVRFRCSRYLEDEDCESFMQEKEGERTDEN